MTPITTPHLLRLNGWFWLLVLALDMVVMLLEATVWPDNIELKYFLLSGASALLQWLFSSILMLYARHRQYSSWQLVLSTLLLGFCYVPFINFSLHVLSQSYDFDLLLLLGQLDVHLMAFFTWAVTYLVYNRYALQQQKTVESHRLQQQIQQLELKALGHQLNPHFTFNALNSVCALLEAERFDDAEKMSEQLAMFLRYSLSHSPDALVRLADEIAAIEAYLQLQKTRFGDKLQVQWQIDQQIMAQAIPPLLLQPLVENAIKYAVAARQSGATICIQGQQLAQQVLLAVSDNGPGQSSQHAMGTGVGLRNIRDRLFQHFGARASININAAPSGFAVQILLPPQESV